MLKGLSRYMSGYLQSILYSIVIAILFSYLEYFYILKGSLPYRINTEPVIAQFFVYQLFPVIPIFIVVSFMSLLSLKRRVALYLGLANFSSMLIVNDAFWFIFRILTPLPEDPAAGQWIRPADWTCVVASCANLGGVQIPIWYLLLIPYIVAVYLSITLTGNR